MPEMIFFRDRKSPDNNCTRNKSNVLLSRRRSKKYGQAQDCSHQFQEATMSGKTIASRLSSVLVVIPTMLGGLAACAALAQTAPTPVKVFEKFMAPSSNDDGKPRGISGMACLGKAGDATRECLVINDEERFGEVATLTKEGLTPKGKAGQITFVQEGDTGAGVVGVQPKPMCKEKGKFGELDGEGVAVAGDFAYVTSSHSCSGGGKFKPSSFLLTRFKLNSPTSFRGDSEPVVQRSWRLSDALLGSDKVHDDFGKPKEIGTNIEGIAVIGGRLYAGLRTPVRAATKPDEATAFIVSAPVADLFASGPDPLDKIMKNKNDLKTREVRLGPEAGIRDLAALKSGKLLILSGPTETQDVPYKLWLLEQPDSDDKSVKTLHPLITVTTPEKGSDGKIAKAETVVVIDEDSNKLKLLVLYDNINEGGPMRHEITLP
jgi:hypothetical protein